MLSRTDLVSELVRNPRISGQAIQALKAYGWDCDEILATVEKKDVLSVLAEYRAGRLTADEVESWANRIEGRDDVDYEYGPEGVVNEVVFCLANPVLNYPINVALCDRIEKASLLLNQPISNPAVERVSHKCAGGSLRIAPAALISTS